MTFTVHWEGWFRAANPRVNPTDKDNRLTCCSGFCKLAADNADHAKRMFWTAFPDTKILAIT